jgi:hypothetical protein
VTPKTIHESLTKASPILFRAFVGLGSYPWQNYPLDRLLWGPLFAVARMFRTYHETNVRLYQFANSDEWGHWPALHQPTLLVLFQGMTSIDFPNRTDIEDDFGFDDNDIPVSSVLRVARSLGKRDPINPCEAKPRYKIECYALPPTRSSYQRGRISCSTFKDLINLLIFLMFYEHGLGSETLLHHKDDLRVVCDALFEVFYREVLIENGEVLLLEEELNYITWPIFQRVITTQMVFFSTI